MVPSRDSDFVSLTYLNSVCLNSLHHLSNHPSVSIVGFYETAMNPLPCTVLVDTLLPA